MELKINGVTIEAQAGQTLRDLIVLLGFDSEIFQERPLAARIAGEVFNLNYMPVRRVEMHNERPSVRAAMAASKGVVQLLSYADPSGKDVYSRTAQFVIFLALHRLWPEARAKMNCTVGSALYICVEGAPDFDAEVLKKEVSRIVAADYPLVRCRTTTENAVKCYEKAGKRDKAALLKWRKEQFFDQYICDSFADYYYGELAPSTSYLRVWDILPTDSGFFFLYPDNSCPDRPARYQEMPKFLAVSTEGERWCRLMACETVADLNELTKSGEIRELIRVNEALHEKRYSQVADMICQQGAKAVLLAGPSSSGKTTSANRLATQLRVHGMNPILMGLDDYYIDRDMIPIDQDGKRDFEHIDTIDTTLFGCHLADLLQGKAVELPTYNFVEGRREWQGRVTQLQDNSVIIIEGLHALNPVLIPNGLNEDLIFRLYISPLLPLNLDDHNRIPSSYLRLLRRIVRDFETRGASVEATMDMWDSVRRGERKWIFPYQENADVFFNSSTLYELAVLKKHIFPLLTAITPDQQCYEQVRSIVKVLNYVLEADVDDEIPPTSLVREFIGGNTFYNKK